MTPRDDNPNPRPRRLAILAAVHLSLVLALLGCRRDRGTAHGEKFPRDDEPRAVDRFVSVQSASAARADATLTAHHFDGRGALNSLGRQKLDLMLRDDDAADPLVVYLDLPSSRAPGAAPAADPRESVRVYLADRGVPESHVEFRSGPNLSYSHPAADGLRGLRRFEGDAAPDASASAPAPGAAGKPNVMTSSPGR
jgi:hypothetical protein